MGRSEAHAFDRFGPRCTVFFGLKRSYRSLSAKGLLRGPSGPWGAECFPDPSFGSEQCSSVEQNRCLLLKKLLVLNILTVEIV